MSELGSWCSAIGALRGHRLHLTAFPRLRRGIAELGTRASSAEQDQWRFRFARDSALEQAGFELVWGFSCQVVVLGFAESSLFGGVSR